MPKRRLPVIWSDGSANVGLNLSLANEGNLAFDSEQLLTVACRHKGEVVSGCGGEVNLALPDGFGPASASLTARLPMGESYAIELDYGVRTLSLPLDVPERILGVEREVWECYSDITPPISNTDYINLCCAGWDAPTIQKWDPDTPIRAWAHPEGDSLFVETLQDALLELSAMLSLELEWVELQHDANFVAFVGLPEDRIK